MTISIKVERKFQKLRAEVLEKAKREFYRDIAAILPVVIKDNYAKGISPVGGKFIKYSKSYVDQIEGRARFFTKNGQVMAISKTNSKGKQLRIFEKGLGVGKLKSPVNLRVTGSMWDSLKARVEKDGVTIYFDSPIAKYHNGEGQVDRKILPKDGESFSRLIMQKIKTTLKENLDKQFNSTKGPYG